MDYGIYWDEKKQKGVELSEIEGIRYISLYVNYSAWIEDIEGNGDAEISIDYRAEDFFDRSGWEFGMNE